MQLKEEGNLDSFLQNLEEGERETEREGRVEKDWEEKKNTGRVEGKVWEGN